MAPKRGGGNAPGRAVSVTPAPEAPLVSVIVPYYNRPALLPRALASLAAQTYPHLEILVIDDASRASPAALVAALGLSRPVRVLSHAVNRGPGAARNTGLDAAAGAFVTFLDCDDEYEPRKIELQVAAILKGPPGPVFCASSTLIERGDGRETPRAPWDPRERLASFLFVACGSVTVNSMMVSTPLARAVRFSETLRDFEDNLFALRCCEGARALFVAGARSRYYNDGRADQLTRTTSLAEADAFLSKAGALLDARERLGFHVLIVGEALFFARPLRFGLHAARALAKGVISPRRLAGLLWGFVKVAARRRD